MLQCWYVKKSYIMEDYYIISISLFIEKMHLDTHVGVQLWVVHKNNEKNIKAKTKPAASANLLRYLQQTSLGSASTYGSILKHSLREQTWIMTTGE